MFNVDRLFIIKYVIDRLLWAAVIVATVWGINRLTTVYERVRIMDASTTCMQYGGNKWDIKNQICLTREDNA